MEKNTSLNPNRIVRYLGKPAKEFTKADIIRFISENGIEMIDFHYAGGDGRLKTLNFVINDLDYLETIFSCGERVDGSSLFSFVEAGSSDLYVMPRFSTAFVDPFSEIPTLGLLCSYFNKDGQPLESAPEYTLHKAHQMLTRDTGFTMEAMGELEFYFIAPEDDLFLAEDQHGYHESMPFTKFESVRSECMKYIAQCGGKIKYGHSEVGNFHADGKVFEQNEIEFLPVAVEEAADQLTIAKWIIRQVAYNYGLNVTFAPKITAGKAGSGLHIHMRILENGKNKMLDNGHISEIARRAIAGMMVCAPSLTAFGNRNPTSYFRLVPHQEAPTNICWGDRNRSVLVRVPLGWTTSNDMCAAANPQECVEKGRDYSQKQTVEFRCPDGSANVYQLIAGLVTAVRYGLKLENALDLAEKTYVDVNIFKPEFKERLSQLKQLPASCCESAERLDDQRAIYESDAVFSTGALNGIIAELKAFNDRTLREEIGNDTERMTALVEKYFHCG